MTHGVSFIDEHRHDPHGGRCTASVPGRAGMLRVARVGALRVARAGHRYR
ncbi:hypothetical protein [Micromonospora sp. LH3U1]|nr:hypothetical protein [Micromonospora sp. LH3U1]WCN78860.1 hypothetical protein PCA76_17690 [Micromonospora sp. LH3U1]